MKKHVIRIWCDRCASKEDEIRAEATTSRTLALDNGRPLVIDLCDTCDKLLFDELTVLLDNAGQPVPPEERKAAPLYVHESKRADCPVCGAEFAASGLVNHVWNRHMQGSRPPAPETCPDCGFEPEPGKNATASVGRHRTTMHAYDPLAEALQVYRHEQAAPKKAPARRARKAAAST